MRQPMFLATMKGRLNMSKAKRYAEVYNGARISIGECVTISIECSSSGNVTLNVKTPRDTVFAPTDDVPKLMAWLNEWFTDDDAPAYEDTPVEGTLKTTENRRGGGDRRSSYRGRRWDE